MGTGLYAWRQRPESRIGALLVPRVRMVPRGAGVRERGAPVHGRARLRRVLGRRVPAPRHELPDGPRRAGPRPGDRRGGIRPVHRGVHAGAAVRRPRGARLQDCGTNLLQITHDESVANALLTCRRCSTSSCSPWSRGADPALAPGGHARPPAVHAGLRVRAARVRPREAGNAGAGEVFPWAAFVATALLPFAFLAGLLRTHVARLDAELMTRLDELRASRARSSRRGTPNAGGSSATSTTAPSRGSWRDDDARAGPARASTARERDGACSTARSPSCGRPRRAARARARHPPGGADRAGAGAGDQRARRARTGAGDGRRARTGGCPRRWRSPATSSSPRR